MMRTVTAIGHALVAGAAMTLSLMVARVDTTATTIVAIVLACIAIVSLALAGLTLRGVTS